MGPSAVTAATREAIYSALSLEFDQRGDETLLMAAARTLASVDPLGRDQRALYPQHIIECAVMVCHSASLSPEIQWTALRRAFEHLQRRRPRLRLELVRQAIEAATDEPLPEPDGDEST